MDIASNTIVSLILAAIAIAILVRLLSWLYVKSSGEAAFVRTGFLGRKVVINGGAFVIPVLHQTTPVNLSTLRLEVTREKEGALITRDLMRVDAQVVFYVRVIREKEAIALAAQTLGARTMNPGALAELVEGKFVDGLRAAAAVMTMYELHENRTAFVAKVKEAIADDLTKNGLELEAASLIHFDQTSLSYYDPKNAFDAEGLTKITEEIEAKRRRRNAIEQDTDLAIRQKEIEVEFRQLALDKERLKIGQETELARLEQAQEIAVCRAAQAATIARQEAERQFLSDTAVIDARIRTAQADLKARHALVLEQLDIELAETTARIDHDRRVKELDDNKIRLIELSAIDREQQVEAAREGKIAALLPAIQKRIEAECQAEETRLRAKSIIDQVLIETSRQLEVVRAKADCNAADARLVAEKAVRELEFNKQRALEIVRSETMKAISVAETDRAVTNANLEIGVAEARTRAEAARMLHIKAQESVATEQTREQKFREKVAAELGAELARIAAQGDADAERIRSEAARRLAEVEADARRMFNEADNALSADQVALRVKLESLQRLPEIIRESVKPLERIESIRIAQVDGLLGRGGHDAGDHGLPGNGRGPAEQVVDAALRYRVQAPLIEGLLNEVGLASDIAQVARSTGLFPAGSDSRKLEEPAAGDGSERVQLGTAS